MSNSNSNSTSNRNSASWNTPNLRVGGTRQWRPGKTTTIPPPPPPRNRWGTPLSQPQPNPFSNRTTRTRTRTGIPPTSWPPSTTTIPPPPPPVIARPPPPPPPPPPARRHLTPNHVNVISQLKRKLLVEAQGAAVWKKEHASDMEESDESDGSKQDLYAALPPPVAAPPPAPPRQEPSKSKTTEGSLAGRWQPRANPQAPAQARFQRKDVPAAAAKDQISELQAPPPQEDQQAGVSAVLQKLQRTTKVQTAAVKDKTYDSLYMLQPTTNNGTAKVELSSTPVVFEDDRAIRLHHAKEKLRHAQNKLVSALKKRKGTFTPPPVLPQLPPITALSQSLLVTNISGQRTGNFFMVRPLPEPVLLKVPCDIIPPYDSDEEEEPECLHQKGEALRKNLLLLRKKKLELTLRMQQQNGGATTVVGEGLKDPSPNQLLVVTKESLKKRQEEMQKAVDCAYWKRLVLQQRNLLATEQKEVVQHETNLRACQEQIKTKRDGISECAQNIQESMVREQCLDEMIAKATQQVLSARKRRHEATQDSNKVTRSKRRHETTQPVQEKKTKKNEPVQEKKAKKNETAQEKKTKKKAPKDVVIDLMSP